VIAGQLPVDSLSFLRGWLYSDLATFTLVRVRLAMYVGCFSRVVTAYI
jgi:hypothetical protein